MAETLKSVIDTKGNINEKAESGRFNRIARSIGAIGATSAVLLGSSIASTEIASPAGADEQVFVGGNCNPNGDFVLQQAIDKGFYNPNARHPEIVYPASIAPICGNETMRQSMNIGADQLMREYQNNAPGEHFYVESFSLGSGVANEFGNRLTNRGRDPLPHNVHLINNGDAYGATGILNHPIAPIARIVTDFMGIPPASEIKPAPGTLVRFDINDFWGNGGVQGLDLGAVISMAARIPQDHRIPNPAEPHQTFEHKGVTYEVYGLENRDGISRAIIEAGGDPHDIGRWFFGILNGPQNPADMWRYNTAKRHKLAESIAPIHTRQENPANFNPVRNVPQVTLEQVIASPPPPVPAPLPVPEAIVIPPPPVSGQPMSPEQLAFAEQLRSAATGIK